MNARVKRLEGWLGVCFLLAAVGLFVPGPWTDALFGAVLVAATVGLYVETELRAQGSPGPADSEGDTTLRG